MNPPAELTTSGDLVFLGVKRPLFQSLVALIPAVVLLVIIAWIQVATNAGAGGYDSIADWVTVNASLDGVDAGMRIVDLADRYGVNLPAIDGPTEAVHPRTPGGLVLVSPLALVGGEVVYMLSVIVATVATIVLLVWVTRSFALTGREAMVGSLLVLPSGYVYGALEFGAISPLVTLLVFAYWRALQTPDMPRRGGVALGLAISLKIFPAAFLVFAVARKRRTVLAWSIGSAVVLGVVGLLWFDGASVSSVVDTLRIASRQWIPFDGNLSLAGIIAAAGMTPTLASMVSLTVGAIWVAFVWHRSDGVDRVMTLMTVAILMTWPMVWGHYMFLAIPVVAFLWTSGGLTTRRLVIAWLVAWVILPALWLWTEVPSVLEQVSLASLQLLLVAAVHAAGFRVDRAASNVDTSGIKATNPD